MNPLRRIKQLSLCLLFSIGLFMLLLSLWLHEGYSTTKPSSSTTGQWNNARINILPHTASVSSPSSSSKENLEYLLKFQKEEMERFCEENPTLSDIQVQYRRMLYNDQHKIIYCYLPKVGCTNIKLMFLVLAGKFPANTSVPHYDIHTTVGKNPKICLMSSLSPKEQEWRMKEYFKFVVLREPSERLLSGYIDKLELPLSPEKHLLDPIKQRFMRKFKKIYNYRPDNKTHWNGSTIRYVPFEDYLKYLYSQNDSLKDEHFAPMHFLCSPCVVKYDFYVQFDHMAVDMYKMMSHLNLSHWLLPTHPEHSKVSTKDLMRLYYSKMDVKKYRALKKDLFLKTNHPFISVPDGGVDRQLLKRAFDANSIDYDWFYRLFSDVADTREQYF